MPGPLDDTLKHLTEFSPQDWVVRGGWPAAPATLIDADIATITGATDKVIHVAASPGWLLAVDFHAGHDVVAKLPDLLLYNSALFKRHRLRVRSLLVLLHRGADSPQVTGFYERGFPDEPFDAALRYRVLRVWEVPAEKWLAGGLGQLPQAPLGAVQEAELPSVITRIKERLDQEERGQAAELWSAIYLLMGLRYPDALIETLLQGASAMEESVTYQKIVGKSKAEGKAEGKAEEARRILLLMGQTRFGEAPPEIVAALESLTEVTRLEALAPRLLQVSSWQELLSGNG